MCALIEAQAGKRIDIMKSVPGCELQRRSAGQDKFTSRTPHSRTRRMTDCPDPSLKCTLS